MPVGKDEGKSVVYVFPTDLLRKRASHKTQRAAENAVLALCKRLSSSACARINNGFISAQVGKDEGKSVVYEFPTDLLREAGVAQGAPPFAVVSSTENDLSVGKCVPFLARLTCCALPSSAQRVLQDKSPVTCLLKQACVATSCAAADTGQIEEALLRGSRSRA